MKIAEVRGYHLRCPLPEPIGSARGFFDRRDSLIIEIVADGISGWGETWSAPEAAAPLLRSRMIPRILGQDATQIGALWGLATAAGGDRRGTAMDAVAAIDMALHDLVARARNVPVASLLGGALRDRVLAYASGPFMRPDGHPYRAYQAEVEAYLRLGFRAIKPRSGFNPREDGIIAAALRKQIGPDHALMFDFNQSYTARAAIAAAQRMADADLLWIEEPVGPEDIGGYRTVARAIDTAVAGGEALATAAAFRDFLAADAIAVLQPDLAVCGGFTGVRTVSALAEAFELPVVPHVWGTVVGFYAALQLAAVLPARRGGGPMPYPFLEFDRSPHPGLLVFGDPPLNPDGTLSIPHGPGIGIEISARDLAPWIVESWVEAP
jgi:L-alanine-DL-glutamate epimerase-like enolase superfamily enzyme